MKKYKTIADLHKAVQSGEVDEAKLSIVLDNDATSFADGHLWDEDDNELDNKIEVEEANGYDDISPLYALLFPRATVEWC